jgi:hypothetical protein
MSLGGGRLTAIGYRVIRHDAAPRLYIDLHSTLIAAKGWVMTDPAPKREPRHPSTGMAGGFFMFIALIAGAIMGIAYNQPSLGMISGFVIGGAIATVIWLFDRRKG